MSGADVVVPLERHALTIAGSGAGKGACQIIPNLLRWPHSVLVIDPKGEAAEATAEHRATVLGQKVAVLDPFEYAKKASRFWQTFNPLQTVRSVDDLNVLVDGLVMRTGRETETHWNESAADVIAGLLAAILEAGTEGTQELGSLRLWLAMLADKNKRAGTLDLMAGCTEFGNLALLAASRLSRDTNETASVLSTVQTQLRWLSSPEMTECLGGAGTLDLAELKTGKLSLYVVLPPDKLDLHGRFLRLVVRAAMSVMQARMEDGSHKGTPCLFILDEFFSLGRIGEIQKAAGLMRAYGLHLWPFLQDLGQLETLYEVHGAQTFIGNADAVCCFGIGDFHTAAAASNWIGQVTADDVKPEVMSIADRLKGSQVFSSVMGMRRPGALHPLEAELKLVEMRVGRPRRAPDAVMRTTAKEGRDMVARRMLVFRGGGVQELAPSPHFAPYRPQK